MADVLFRYLLAARAHDHAWHQRAFLRDERLLAASIERVIETVALRIELVSQHERVTTAHVVAPASRVGDVAFFHEVVPHEPRPDAFETRTDRFPLAASLQVGRCEPCQGAGVLDCSCNLGREACLACRGESLLSTRCPVCDGDGVVICRRCRGLGMFKHEECNGEGRVASWQEEVRTYTVKSQRDALLPPDAPVRAMAAAADAWLEKHDRAVEKISDEAIPEALGYSTPEVTLMLRAAQRVVATFRQKAQTDPEQHLFSAVRVRYVPVSACVLRTERSGRSGRFWLVGRGEDAIELRPSPQVDAWKGLGWPGLVLGGGAAAGLVLQLGAPALLAPEWLSAGATALFTGMAGLGLPAAGVGLKRIALGSGPPIRTIAVIPCSGQPSRYLTCLPTLGSYLNRLELGDRSYKATIESMMGAERPAHQSQTIVVQTKQHGLLRLIEITQAQHLSRSELARMMEAVNGVLFLEEPDHSCEALRRGMHSATTARPPEASLLVEPRQGEADDHGLGPGGGLALEAIRRGWIRERQAPFEWTAVFDGLWSPVEMLLSGVRVPLVRRTRTAALRRVPGMR